MLRVSALRLRLSFCFAATCFQVDRFPSAVSTIVESISRIRNKKGGEKRMRRNEECERHETSSRRGKKEFRIRKYKEKENPWS